MLTGERGMGKSSLMRVAKDLATGKMKINDELYKLSYMVVDVEISNVKTQLDLVKNIILGLWDNVSGERSARTYFQTCFSFLPYDEIDKLIYTSEFSSDTDSTLIQHFSNALTKFVNRICSIESETIFRIQYDGLLLLIDEADYCSVDLKLGNFVKHLSERVYSGNCNYFMIGLAGGTNLANFLASSHPSAPRLFKPLKIDKLTNEEVNQLIDLYIVRANEINQTKMSITENARNLLIEFAEGRPYFIQEYGYSTFLASQDDTIDEEDVGNGIFGSLGALKHVGTVFYFKVFNSLSEEYLCRILQVFSQIPSEWMSVEHIKNNFIGEETLVDQAILELHKHQMIIKKAGDNDLYRIKNIGFAYWIKHYSQEGLPLRKGLL